jgi:hypothetical protein
MSSYLQIQTAWIKQVPILSVASRAVSHSRRTCSKMIQLSVRRPDNSFDSDSYRNLGKTKNFAEVGNRNARILLY